MVDAYEILQEVLGRVNIEENGYLPASLFNTYAREANRYVFNDYIDRLQNPQTAAREKQKLEDRLGPFEVRGQRMSEAGIFTIPDGCAYFRNAKMRSDGGSSIVKIFALQAELCEAAEDPTININDIQRQINELVSSSTLCDITLLDHDQIASRLNSYIPGKKPSLKKPVMERITMVNVPGFLIYPAGDYSIFFSYYRRPAAVNLVMKQDPLTLEPIYDKEASTGFEWQSEAMTDVVNKIVISFATYIREGGLFQMTQTEAKP